MARDQLDPGEVEALINELEQKMQRLRSIYEQYFMGIERMPPTTLRKEVVRLIHTLENVYVRNTATKFKIRSLVQRFNSYKAYWNRIERQIEEGTYTRDVQRAQRNSSRRDRRAQRAEGGGGDADDGIVELDFEEVADLDDLQAELERMDAAGAFDRRPAEPSLPEAPGSSLSDEERERRKQQKLAEIRAQLGGGAPETTAKPQPTPPSTSAPARGAPVSMSASRPTEGAKPKMSLSDIKRKMQERTGEQSRPATPPPSRGGGGGDDDARRVYNQLLEAKRSLNESTAGLSYEAVSKSMSKQREQLREKRGADDVEFKVVIKDGRAFLKPETK